MCTNQYRVLSTEYPAPSAQHSALSAQHSALSAQHSALSTQHPALAQQRGASLIELITFIMLISIALAGILLVMNLNTAHSADALVRKQALAVADALLEEIEAQPFSGTFVGPYTQTNRASFDSVFNYNGFATSGIFPADGSPTGVPGLSNYNVAASVTALSSAWGTIPAASAVQITVTVTGPGGMEVVATGYRTAY